MALRVAVIGLGHWGPNYVRILRESESARLMAVVDTDPKRHERLKSLRLDVACLTDYREVLKRDDVDAVVIATPTSTHYTIVKAALQAGKHVLCEKPLTTNSAEAWELTGLAASQARQLMNGHVFLFNPGIEYLARARGSQTLGRIYYLNAVRTNLGPFRSDVNAAWDLASHDVYIFNHILGQRPQSVAAIGGRYLRATIEDIVFLTMRYADNVLGHVHISWLDPKKVRQMTIVGERQMLTWDEFGTPGPIMIYDRSVQQEKTYDTFGEFQLLTREGDVVVPRIPPREPLQAQITAFVKRCLDPADADARGRAQEGAETVDVLETACRSLAEGGRMLDIPYGG